MSRRPYGPGNFYRRKPRKPFNPYRESRYAMNAYIVGGYSNSGNPARKTCNWVPREVSVTGRLTNWRLTSESAANWRQKIASGRSATTGLEGVRLSHRFNQGQGMYQAKPHLNICQRGTAFGNLGCDLIASAVYDVRMAVSTEAENQARRKLLDDYIETTNTFRGGNFLAEVVETIRFVVSPLRSMYKDSWDFARKLEKLKGRFLGHHSGGGVAYARRQREWSERAADLWLAFSLGLRPLYGDVQDASALLSELTNGNRHDVRPIKGIGNDVAFKPVSDQPYSSASGLPYARAYIHNFTDDSVIYKGAVTAKPVGSYNLAQEAGVQIFDIIPAVWEAIPFSFLLDYFANVGEQLDALRLAEAHVAWLNRTVRNTHERQVWLKPYVSDPSSFTSFVTGGGGFARVRYVNRSSLAAIPYPAWHFRIPGIGSLKWLNIAALGRQWLRTRP